jgi:tetratricopeptide (TPR) repeat protein
VHLLLATAAILFVQTAVIAAELPEVRKLYRTGKFAECARQAAAEIKNASWDPAWPILEAEAELAQGKYEAALHTVKEGMAQYPSSLKLLLLARTAYRFNNEFFDAERALDAAARNLAGEAGRFQSPTDRIALGRLLLERGADPRQILELIYDPLRKSTPELADAYFATAELALDKCDNALAADTLQKAPKSLADDPQYHYLLARAYLDDAPDLAQKEVDAALEINPNHVDSRLLYVDLLVLAEDFPRADAQLDRIFQVNSNHPVAWAYKAVIAHLTSDSKAEEAARTQALSTWRQNPEVDYTIGKKLSQHYRFTEGAEYQRMSLVFDPKYRPAKLQLSQDLLSLGEETEGWRLVDELAKQDAYDVRAYNLVTLRDELTKFRTIGSDDLHIRMEAREADLYGDRALELIQRARKTLCEKYKVKLDARIVIEIFPKQKDFDVRTFGMPGEARGYLGICFGRVITANSPASQGESPANWESVLWHEFCHVVTLHKTRNRMPRWLSEGISVYEERQANPTWGQTMNPYFREFILGGDLTPVSQLSSAFIAPESALHMQFAYFESSLVVQYLIDRFGMERLLALLDDLGAGKDINEALVLHTEPLNRLDADFADFARKQAEGLAKGARFDEPDYEEDADATAITYWMRTHPNNVPGLKQSAREQLRDRKFDAAIETAKHLREIFPNDTLKDNAYVLLAEAYRGTDDIDAEYEALEALASRSDDAVDAYLRLAEIAEQKKAWSAVAKNANRALAVNPLIAAPHRYLAKAATELGERSTAIRASQSLLTFDNSDVAEIELNLAKLLRDENQLDAARRHTLMALEEAPRYLAAHKLLLEFTPGEAASAAVSTTKPSDTAEPTPPTVSAEAENETPED